MNTRRFEYTTNRFKELEDLDKLGWVGWELVHLEPEKPESLPLALFKREINPYQGEKS